MHVCERNLLLSYVLVAKPAVATKPSRKMGWGRGQAGVIPYDPKFSFHMTWTS